jgi:hypothetical protein
VIAEHCSAVTEARPESCGVLWRACDRGALPRRGDSTVLRRRSLICLPRATAVCGTRGALVVGLMMRSLSCLVVVGALVLSAGTGCASAVGDERHEPSAGSVEQRGAAERATPGARIERAAYRGTLESGDSAGTWWRTYEGADLSARDSAVAIAIDPKGRAVVLARLADRAFGVVVYGVDGSLAWARSFRDPSDDADVATSLALDAAGNVVAAGTWQRSDAPLGGFLVVSFDPDGALRWSARSEGGGALSGLAVDGSGRVVVTGGGSDGTHTLARTIAYDGGGKLAWEANEVEPLGFGANGRHVAIDAAGNAYVAGESSDGANDQVTLYAYDARGQKLWTTRANEDPTHVPQSTAQALALDASGAPHVAVARAYRASRDAEPSVELVVAKYDPAGHAVWSASIKEGTRNIATAIAVDASGRVTATGFAGSPHPDSYLTVQYDADGTRRWSDRCRWDVVGEHQARALAVDKSGNAYVTGSAVGPDAVTSFGSIAYGPDGSEIWRRLDRAPNDATSSAAALVLHPSGALFIAGSVLGGPRGVVAVLKSAR